MYADAGRREGLAVNGAFVHDMGTANRHAVDVTDTAIEAAEATVLLAAESLRARDFTPTPEKSKCGQCDVRDVCNAAFGGRR